MLKEGVREKFLTNTDATGRFIVKSLRTGRTYFVEPLGDPHRVWGDMDPATKTLSGDYGNKYKGSVKESESLITDENGFVNIRLLDPGTSPLAVIEEIDDKVILNV